MGHFVYAILLLVAIIVAILLRRNERRAKERVARECDAIRVEERRMFSFLRGLGEKLQADHSVSNLHRFVVDGVAEVVKGDAGVLYLLDGETGQLVPVYQSAKTCPVLPVPIEVLAVQNPVEAENQYRSFIRLSALQSGDSFLCDLVR